MGGGLGHEWGGIDVYNSIIWDNTATNGANYMVYGSRPGTIQLAYCCTLPMPSSGIGNITNEPQLASASHLSVHSPCIAAGNTNYARGVDIDGEPWGDPPSIGCDEVHWGSATGTLSVAIRASGTYGMIGSELEFTAEIEGRTTGSRWSFGDETVASNRPYVTHVWSIPGDYPVVLTAFNESHPSGVSARVTVHVTEQIYYVAVGSAHPIAPYRSWATAASNIQDAVDEAVAPGALVLVSNGVYRFGGRAAGGQTLTNRVSIDKPLTVRSVNGPQRTAIVGTGSNGDAAVRCVYMGSNACLVGFTLTNGSTRLIGDLGKERSGGGAWCESSSAVLSNCVLTGNRAGYYGGGTYNGALYNCTLVGNNAIVGGGTRYSVLYNCTFIGNSANYYGGGASQGALYNCIVYYNTAPIGSNYHGAALNCCCATPDPGGMGNITNEPLFVDRAAGNLRLSSDSPCIDAGIYQDWMSGSVDLDGEPRIMGGVVDMGAYEYKTGSVIPLRWLQKYGLSADGRSDFTDPDADGMNNWQEWRCNTVPIDLDSFLRFTTIVSEGTGVVVRWWSAEGARYRLKRLTHLNIDAVGYLVRTKFLPRRRSTRKRTRRRQ